MNILGKESLVKNKVVEWPRGSTWGELEGSASRYLTTSISRARPEDKEEA